MNKQILNLERRCRRVFGLSLATVLAVCTQSEIHADDPIVTDYTINMSPNSSTLLTMNGTTSINIYVENVMPNPSGSNFTFILSKPSGPTGLSVSVNSSPLWTVTTNSTQYVFTATGPLAANSYVTIPITVTRIGGASGYFNFSGIITDPADVNSSNNNANLTVLKLH